jgi:pyruvate-formate lyase
MRHGPLGFSPQWGGTYTYYYHRQRIEEAIAACPNYPTQRLAELVRSMNFWEQEQTIEKLQLRFQSHFGYRLPNSFHEPGFVNCDGRIAGTNVDLKRLLRLGIPGLRQQILNRTRGANEEEQEFLDCLAGSLNLIVLAADLYMRDIQSQLAHAKPSRRVELQHMAADLYWISNQAPKTFAQALQLFWLYAVCSDLLNFGRMDDYLGDFYQADLNAGRLNQEEAIALLSSVWRQIARIGKVHDSRVIIGGAGRHNPHNADALALVIMETSRRMHDVVPQLTLRHHPQNQAALFDKAMAMLAEGYCYPIIYSDSTNIHAVSKALLVSSAEAERYVPFGCGEYVLEGLSMGTPNNGVNLLKALELVLHDGYDHYWQRQVVPPMGGLASITSFEDLLQRYEQLVEQGINPLAVHKKLNYHVAGEEADFLFISLLMDDCIAKAKPLLRGGVRYLNAASEIFGLISCADSLSAIQNLVYHRQLCTLTELVAAMDANFSGYDHIHKACLNAPKYGNDDPIADKMANYVFDQIAQATIQAGTQHGLHRYLIVSVWPRPVVETRVRQWLMPMALP